MFSSRVPSERTPNRITDALAAVQASAAPYLDLTESNPTQVGLDYPAALLQSLGQARGLMYQPSAFGLLDARRAAAADFARRGVDVAADHVVLTASTSEAYGLLFKLLCDPGDAVLIPRPSYPLFEHLTRLDAVRMIAYDLDYHGRWTVDLEGLERRITPETRAILVVSPNNPTGSFLSGAELESLAELCGSRSLALIGDEVFADYAWSETSPISVLTQRMALTFSLGGLSKSVGLPQLKLGWIAIGGPSDLVREARDRLAIIGDTYLSVATPVQLALAEMLDQGAVVREQIRKRVVGNRHELQRIVRRHPSCQVLGAEGGWYAVVKVPATESEDTMVVELLEHERVLVHPGYFFDFPSEAFMVVSLLPRAQDFAQGVEAMCRRLAAAD